MPSYEAVVDVLFKGVVTMTTKRVVADDILGKFTRKIMDLLRRVVEGSVEIQRAAFFLQRAIENPPAVRLLGPGDSAMYLLECYWAYDKSHYEYATITLEWTDFLITFEDLSNPDLSMESREFLLGTLRRVYEAQIPGHGNRRMMRLYRVGYRNCLGNFEGSVGRPLRDLHFSLEPICEFDEEGQPVPVETS